MRAVLAGPQIFSPSDRMETNMKRSRILPLIGTALGLALASPATAMTVYDPTNYAQNVLQAARALQQINNQVQALQNDAQSLLNQAKNLASLPYSSLQTLKGSVDRTRALLDQAKGIAHDVGAIDQAFRSTYSPAAASDSQAQLVARAQGRWHQSVDAFQDALKVQAGVVSNLTGHRQELEALIGASQGAGGALQAAQAGNQLLALASQQLADLTAAIAAQGRAQSFAAAQTAAAQDQGREHLRRFLSPRSAYQPTSVTLFRR